jgi:hypothetical protein
MWTGNPCRKNILARTIKDLWIFSHLKALQCDVSFCKHVRYTEKVVRSEVRKQILVLRLAILFYWLTVFFIFFSGWKCLECALFVHHIIYFCQTFIIFLSSSWQVFIAREQICLKRLGISNTQCCRTPSYKSEVKRKRSSVRLVELLKLESIKGEKKGLCVYFLSTEIPVYTCWWFKPVMYWYLLIGG